MVCLRCQFLFYNGLLFVHRFERLGKGLRIIVLTFCNLEHLGRLCGRRTTAPPRRPMSTTTP